MMGASAAGISDLVSDAANLYFKRMKKR